MIDGAAVNQFHAILRKLSIEDAIALIAAQIPKRGHGAVKNDPAVFAWVMENQDALKARIAARANAQ